MISIMDMTNWPDWQDTGKFVEITMPDGRIFVGRLMANDMTPGPDEAPIFTVHSEKESLDFCDADSWRFVP
jgi:hypothetical protein